jgi:hypothetical protein
VAVNRVELAERGKNDEVGDDVMVRELGLDRGGDVDRCGVCEAPPSRLWAVVW